MEELHGHDWVVRVAIRGVQLDSEDLLVDFHALEASLRAVLAPFEGRTMNGVPPFDRLMPTAERVAELVGTGLAGNLAEHCSLAWVSVQEAPGCIARWFPPNNDLEIH